MKLIVLVKQVPDTGGERALDLTTGRVDREASEPVIDEIVERALEVALGHKDANKGTEVVALSMGPDTTVAALRRALAMGADSAVLVQDDDLRGSDVARTSAVLAAALRRTGFDLVVAGNESTDGRGGMVPAMVAEHLGVPHLTFLNAVEITGNEVAGVRAGDDGTEEVRAPLPAVLSVTERAAEPRYPSFKGIMTAKRKPLEVLTLTDLDGQATASASRTTVVSTSERPPRAAGTKIVDTGTAGAELADFLAAARLI
ncbi:electron transfer flavoprotein subunit beta/FixA family protein [Georgenia thermotolerans]|uniref:Electron transfer flavoprotein subunit beta n=1 Tax=Georgenia thermotolerans TaxID=527326 RepID=A0A7J5UUC6_9MICO|nr:electron transfer flavoprotein subunit beta/FixA family protein [Georgenia thermotolerans]KAE8765891.1 electron transfer flavoprotein subunit beta [Georgenia thermotolerans]